MRAVQIYGSQIRILMSGKPETSLRSQSGKIDVPRSCTALPFFLQPSAITFAIAVVAVCVMLR